VRIVLVPPTYSGITAFLYGGKGTNSLFERFCRKDGKTAFYIIISSIFALINL
jgi:hypothetical protein